MINMGATALDVVWFLLVLYAWKSSTTHDEYVWESLSGLHNMSLFLTFVNIGVKVTCATNGSARSCGCCGK